MEQYLERCLTSLIIDSGQMDLMQVLVINDGSKDRSSEIAHSFEDKYPDTYMVIDKENGNYGSCFNCGIELAMGKYVRLLDADDWFNAEGLSDFINHLKYIDTDVVVTNYSNQYIDGSKIEVCIRNVKFDSPISASNFSFLKSGNKKLIAMHALTYKTKFIKRINLKLQTGISYTDSVYDMLPIMKSKDLTFVNVNLYQYFLGRPGQTVSFDALKKGQGALTMLSNFLIDNYLEATLTNSQKDNCLKIIGDTLINIYRFQLMTNKSNFSNEFIALNNKILSSKDLKTLTNKFTYKKIPYVFLWRTFGIRFSCLF